MGPAYADYKIATVDVNRVLNESSEAQTKKHELDQKQSEARKKIEQQGKTLQEQEKKIKDAKLAESSKEVEKFKADARDFNRLVRDTEEDLKKEFLKFNKTLAEKAVKIVSSHAQKNDIDLVFDKSEKGRGPVLFGDSTFDITDAIIKEMNS